MKARSTEKAGPTGGQNRMMWGLVSRLQKNGLDRDDATDVLRRITSEVSGQKSTKALSVSEATQVIDRLKRMVDGTPDPKKKAKGPTISKKQLGAIDQVRKALGWSASDYNKFSNRMLGQWPQTSADGNKIYEGLKAMLRRRYTPKYLRPHVQALLIHVHTFSTEDRNFVESIAQSLKKRGRLGAGQLGILLKIGGRYGHEIPPDPDAK